MSSKSPKKKKSKLSESSTLTNALKREIEDNNESNKRFKTDIVPKVDIQALKRKNFVTACELVSYKAYHDYRMRFQLVCMPSCATSSACKHHDHKNGVNIKVIPSYAEESLKIEMKTNMWQEALEVCFLCITPDQYLSANVLKNVVEIMLNAHDDEYADYTIDQLLDMCKEVFELNFSYHPPCLFKSIRKCYTEFLTSPMDLKDNTFTNRTQFGYNKGVVKYCFNRLEYELSIDSEDGPLVDKYENIPEEMKQSVKGMHWQKEKFEIYELLERPERIQRLISVLDSIIQLLQTDLVIWHSRYTNNLGSHIMRSHKPLMAFLLWSDNVLYTGAVNNNCRQILRLFVYLIHLEYPEDHIHTMAAWLNAMIQTFYICENNSNSDYPNTGKYCTAFANEFYKIISEMPHKSIVKILEQIKPDYMQYLIGNMHLQTLLSPTENIPIIVFTDFLKHKHWNRFNEYKDEVIVKKKQKQNTSSIKNFTKYVIKFCDRLDSEVVNNNENPFLKFNPENVLKESKTSLNHIVQTFYITLEAYLDAYSVQNVQETLDSLNEKLHFDDTSMINDDNCIPDFCAYSVTEHFIKNYRGIYQALKELVLLLQEMKNSGNLPSIFKIFEKIDLLGM